jgi:hypothetical protein
MIGGTASGDTYGVSITASEEWETAGRIFHNCCLYHLPYAMHYTTPPSCVKLQSVVSCQLSVVLDFYFSENYTLCSQFGYTPYTFSAYSRIIERITEI